MSPEGGPRFSDLTRTSSPAPSGRDFAALDPTLPPGRWPPSDCRDSRRHGRQTPFRTRPGPNRRAYTANGRATTSRLQLGKAFEFATRVAMCDRAGGQAGGRAGRSRPYPSCATPCKRPASHSHSHSHGDPRPPGPARAPRPSRMSQGIPRFHRLPPSRIPFAFAHDTPIAIATAIAIVIAIAKAAAAGKSQCPRPHSRGCQTARPSVSAAIRCLPPNVRATTTRPSECPRDRQAAG